MTNSSREQMEKAFSMGEANVALEGFDAHAHPLYATLKAKVLSGEMTASEMSDRRHRLRSSRTGKTFRGVKHVEL